MCYGVPGGELCVIFEPSSNAQVATTPPPANPTPSINRNPNNLPLGYTCADGSSYELIFIIGNNLSNPDFVDLENKTYPFLEGIKIIADDYEYATKYADSGGTVSGGTVVYDPFNPEMANTAFGVGNWVVNKYSYATYTRYQHFSTWSKKGGGTSGSWVAELNFEYDYEMYTRNIPFYIDNQIGHHGIINNFKVYLRRLDPVICPVGSPIPKNPSITPPPSVLVPVVLPNTPPTFKPMNNCCDKIEEIYKYLGIAKLKKNKFPVSNAFLVPGGKGNDNCVDYYAITQALFRMLANGLIINPKSKPLGSEWQNANATAWASAMYEMMAETMSDGNSTQRFEIAAMMQMVQMMAAVAENGRKIEFVADAIGFEPVPVPEELPVCFTIFEGHKGFGKKEPKKINVSGLKTDTQVENARQYVTTKCHPYCQMAI
ncbi:hypothetical protein QUA71_19645 [Microcoleus sp. MON1_C5]|uniref:hypothetical protein n=1 Tax=Microcoleus sp. MON1_C5 TaxID=2818828 RepID=UPI002FCEBACD